MISLSTHSEFSVPKTIVTQARFRNQVNNQATFAAVDLPDLLSLKVSLKGFILNGFYVPPLIFPIELRGSFTLHVKIKV